MSHDVFISYARSDDSLVDQIEAQLSASGLKCFRDKHDIDDAALWRGKIAEAIRECHAVIAVVSKESANSHYVSTELALAQDFRKSIVPILLTRQVLNDELIFVLGPGQWIFVDDDVSSELGAIEEAAWQAVERSRHP